MVVDNNYLRANSSVATGVEWSPAAGKVFSSVISITVAPSDAETSVLSTTIPASTLGTNNAVRSKLYWKVEQILNAAHSVVGRFQFGGGAIASVVLIPAVSTNSSIFGSFNHTIVSDNNSRQVHFIVTNVINATPQNLGASSIYSLTSRDFYIRVTTSVSSGANQTLGMTIKNTDHAVSEKPPFTAEAVIIEKIT